MKTKITGGKREFTDINLKSGDSKKVNRFNYLGSYVRKYTL